MTKVGRALVFKFGHMMMTGEDGFNKENCKYCPDAKKKKRIWGG